jgi:serine-type D-Ala-D-Ala endopeptidase (penicillin-binding protein 7)
MVFLDASGRSGRVQDAERVRHWVEALGTRRDVARPQG